MTTENKKPELSKLESERGNIGPICEGRSQVQQRFRAYEWGVAEHHQNIIDAHLDGLARHEYGMRGSRPLALLEELRIGRVAARLCRHRIMVGAHYNCQLIVSTRARCNEYMTKQ